MALCEFYLAIDEGGDFHVARERDDVCKGGLSDHLRIIKIKIDVDEPAEVDEEIEVSRDNTISREYATYNDSKVREVKIVGGKDRLDDD